MGVAALLNAVVDRLPVGRPLRRALSIVDAALYLVTLAAVRVHHPHMRVFHRRFRRGERAPGAEIRDVPAVGRPHWMVFGVLGLGEPGDRSVGDAYREDVVVEETIGIGFVIRDEENAIA